MHDANRQTASNGMFARPKGMPTARSARESTPINPATTMPVSGNAFVTSLGLPRDFHSLPDCTIVRCTVAKLREQVNAILADSQASLTNPPSVPYNTFPPRVVHAEFRVQAGSTFCADSRAVCNPDKRSCPQNQ